MINIKTLLLVNVVDIAYSGLIQNTNIVFKSFFRILSFCFAGCSEVPSDMTIDHIVVKPDLGLCFSACSWTNSQYFGLVSKFE